jgi:hypothetical protein
MLMRDCSESRQRADCVEKLRISDGLIFRKEPVIPKGQMRIAIRRSELPHEPQETNLAEPLTAKGWLRCTDRNFTDFAKNGVFQQYRLGAAVRRVLHQGQLCAESVLCKGDDTSQKLSFVCSFSPEPVLLT